jgi:hypothetical protein
MCPSMGTLASSAHEISRDEIAKHSPSLVNKIARKTAISTVADIAEVIAEVVGDA